MTRRSSSSTRRRRLGSRAASNSLLGSGVPSRTASVRAAAAARSPWWLRASISSACGRRASSGSWIRCATRRASSVRSLEVWRFAPACGQGSLPRPTPAGAPTSYWHSPRLAGADAAEAADAKAGDRFDPAFAPACCSRAHSDSGRDAGATQRLGQHGLGDPQALGERGDEEGALEPLRDLRQDRPELGEAFEASFEAGALVLRKRAPD